MSAIGRVREQLHTMRYKLDKSIMCLIFVYPRACLSFVIVVRNLFVSPLSMQYVVGYPEVKIDVGSLKAEFSI